MPNEPGLFRNLFVPWNRLVSGAEHAFRRLVHSQKKKIFLWSKRKNSSEQHQSGLLDELLDFVEELGADRAIDHTVVA